MTTKEEVVTIMEIANRARDLGITNSVLETKMDVQNVHENGCPLRLQDLLQADGFNFSHDIVGIQNNLNRDTKELGNHFLPRYAK